jgi:phosphoribosylglycinamide formyltransferase-1
MTMKKKNLVILISGGGSNMKAIVHAHKVRNWGARYGAHISCVISNKEAAKGLDIAKEYGVSTAVISHQVGKSSSAPSQLPSAAPSLNTNATNAREAFERSLIKEIDQHEPFLVVLAGFMRILGADFVNHYEGRLINIHPSLLPAFPGLHTHARALEMGCHYAGATVHRVTAELDHGPILAQAVVPVLAGDDEHTLAARVLSQEHLIYPRVIEELLSQG